MEAARPDVRYQSLQGSDSEEPQVTVHLYRHSMRWAIRKQKRESCLRILAALLLLTTGLAFAFYELMYGKVEHSDSEEAKWAFVGDQYWNPTLDKDLESAHNGSNGKDGHPDEGDGLAHHHGEEDEDGQHHGEDGDDGHHHGDKDEDGHHHGNEDEDGHPHEDESQADQPPGGHTHEHGVYQHATVITPSDVCSDVGKDVLTAGGNIVDAGISAVLCLCVAHPHAAGIGGVFSTIYYNNTAEQARALNAMSTQATSTRFGFPLVLQGLWLIHQQHGSLDWPKLFEKAVQMAEKGFRIDSILASALRENEDSLTSSSLRDWFCYTNGSLKAEGAVLSNLNLARVLQSAASLMNGPALPDTLTQPLSEDLSSEGVSPSERLSFLESSKASSVAFERPVSLKLDRFTLYGAPPPASGNIIADILKEVNAKKLTPKSLTDAQSIFDAYRHILNASQHGYASGLAEKFNGSIATPSGPPALRRDSAHLSVASVGSHVSAADSEGNVLLLSMTLNSSFGSKFISPSTGILLSDFSGTSSTSLFWACPVVVRLNKGEEDKEKEEEEEDDDDDDDDDVLGVGATGGSSVPISVAQSLINHIYFEKPLKEVASGPRLNVHMGEGGTWHTSISGLSNTSDVLKLLDRAAETGVFNETDATTPLLLVESHAEHVRAFGWPPTCCHFHGF